MIPVIIISGGKQAETAQEVSEILSEACGIMKVESDRVYGEISPDILIIESRQIPKINIKQGIILFAAEGITFTRTIPDGITAVFDAADEGAKSILLNSGCQAVSCGLSGRETLTLSSIDENSAVVSLQRTVITADGTEEIHPFDLILPLKRVYGGMPVLFAAAVLLITGATEGITHTKAFTNQAAQE